MDFFIRSPWAVAGDKKDIPLTTQTDGSVSWPTGWTLDYERNPTKDQNARLIPRDQFNQAMYATTAAIRELQTAGVSPWISSANNGGTPFPYGVGAMVSYQNSIYISLIANNTAEPTPGKQWSPLYNVNPADLVATQKDVSAGTASVTSKFVSPATLRAGVLATVLKGLNAGKEFAAVAATDSVLAAFGKVQGSLNTLNAGKVSSIQQGPGVKVDVSDPTKPIISAEGADFAGAKVVTAYTDTDALFLYDATLDKDELRRITTGNFVTSLRTALDKVYQAAGSYLSLAGGTLTGNLTLKAQTINFLADANRHVRFANAAGKTTGNLYNEFASGDLVGTVVEQTASGADSTAASFRLRKSDGALVVGAGGMIQTDGILRGSAYGEPSGGTYPAISDWVRGSDLVFSGRAFPRRSDGGNINFLWSGQGGQPTWLWGGNDGVNMYIYNPANFNVNWANGAGYADRLGNGGWTLGDVIWSLTERTVKGGEFRLTSDGAQWTNSTGKNVLVNVWATASAGITLSVHTAAGLRLQVANTVKTQPRMTSGASFWMGPNDFVRISRQGSGTYEVRGGYVG